MNTPAAAATPTLGQHDAAILLRRELDDANWPSPRTKHAANLGVRVPDYVVDVSRPDVPWRWTNVLAAPLECLAVAWSIPFLVLLCGLPIVLLVALLHWVGRLALNQF